MARRLRRWWATHTSEFIPTLHVGRGLRSPRHVDRVINVAAARGNLSRGTGVRSSTPVKLTAAGFGAAGRTRVVVASRAAAA
jgi:hypothetical protein